MARRRLAGLLSLATGMAAAGVLLAAGPASACQPESCPEPSPYCQLLKEYPRLPQCVPVY
jgi:hypothetical protein